MPEVDVQLASHCMNAAGAFCLRYWASPVSVTEFEAGLDDDETIKSYERLAEERDRFFYQSPLSTIGRKRSVIMASGEYGGEFLAGRLSEYRWKLRLRFPNESLFQEFTTECRSIDGVSLSLEQVYRETGYSDSDFGLTSSQREALTTALEQGYFDIPRDATLSEVGASLGISDQAVSERLRRGEKQVLERLLFVEREENHDPLSSN